MLREGRATPNRQAGNKGRLWTEREENHAQPSGRKLQGVTVDCKDTT